MGEKVVGEMLQSSGQGEFALYLSMVSTGPWQADVVDLCTGVDGGLYRDWDLFGLVGFVTVAGC